MKDPKLWQVKVKKGQEKNAALCLLNKASDFAMRGTPLEILSATFTENVENYIFVEAYRKNSVYQAIQGLNVFLNKVEILSLNEMPKIYEANDFNQAKMPKVRDWVRVKSGLYDKDLGIVEKATSDDFIIVKLIPRLDLGNSQKRSFGNKKFAAFIRPPQKSYNPAQIRDGHLGKALGLNKFFLQWKGNNLRKGLIYKKFALKQLETVNIKPTTDERAQFLEICE